MLAPFEPLCGQALRAYPGGAAGQFGQDKTESYMIILLANIDMRCNENHLAVLNLLDLQKGGNTIQDWVLHSLFHLTIGKIYYGICVSPSKDYWMLGLDLGNSYKFSKASHSILSHRSSNAEHIKKIFFQETLCQHRLPFTIMSELDMKVKCLFFFFFKH